MFSADQMTSWTDLGSGIKRKIMAFNTQMMTVKVHFQKGAIGERHSHIHTQQTYVASGAFEFSIADQKYTIREGDVCLIPSNVEHGCICLEEGILIDVFNPMRTDFLS